MTQANKDDIKLLTDKIRQDLTGLDGMENIKQLTLDIDAKIDAEPTE